ncbi:hypothetical protein [Brevundimonas sp. FT23042]|uniref:hypothetical protein n=1 Tax=Brevundimonas sp. FT23042 TaxID=3393749 RepID=UPI003B5862A1
MKLLAPLVVFVIAAGPALAQEAVEAPAPHVQPIFRAGDADLTCRQIADEAAALSQQMGGEQGDGVFSSVLGVGRAGVAMLVPGAGLAIAGVDAINRPEREAREAREAAVEQRWYYLNGLYTGLRCNPEAQAAAAAPASGGST